MTTPTRRLRALLLPLLLAVAPGMSHAQVFLPGTQPNEGGIQFAPLRQCSLCHSARSGDHFLDPYGAWNTGMMGHAGQDPVFRAALAIANQDIPGAGNYCLRCHTPRGWVEGRARAPDGSQLDDQDLQGITCDVCHRMVDPLSDEARQYAASVPPGYGNAMMVLDSKFTVRGPYEPKADEGLHPHDNVQSDFQARSEHCGTCHDFSNPYLASDPRTQPPHTYGPLVRTYSEWLVSDFAKEGPEGTCQGCHYPRVRGGGQASRYTSPHRDHFVRMGAIGGATWTKTAIAYLYGREVDDRALEEGVRRSRDFLRTAGELDLKVSGGQARVKITNLTGHKLPTGYPDGTRMWVQVRFVNGEGKVLAERGAYGAKKDKLRGEEVDIVTLLDPGRTTVYEVVAGTSSGAAAKHGVKAGKGLHVILNDRILKDNRIPPRGFTNRKLNERKAGVIGATYPDGQNYDVQTFAVPAGTRKVEARLLYQSVSWESVKFLVEENETDDAGKRLWDAYSNTGMCPPEVIAEASVVL